jgi:hypothetical protein
VLLTHELLVSSSSKELEKKLKHIVFINSLLENVAAWQGWTTLMASNANRRLSNYCCKAVVKSPATVNYRATIMSKRKSEATTSDAEVVLQLLDDMTDNSSESDSDFDGYIDYYEDDDIDELPATSPAHIGDNPPALLRANSPALLRATTSPALLRANATNTTTTTTTNKLNYNEYL